MKKESGFTMLEILIALAIIGLLAVIALPDFSTWKANTRLKSAANDLASNLQWVKMAAIKENTEWAIVFDVSGKKYDIKNDPGADGNWGTADDGSSKKTVSLAGYGSGVGYGHGSAAKNATTTGGTDFDNNVSYDNDRVVFNPNGMLEGVGGYVYLSNEKNTAYAVGTPVTAGSVTLKRWGGTEWN